MTAVTRPSVRAATVRDAADLAAIHVRSWRAAYQGLLPEDYLDALVLHDRVERWQNALRATDWSRAGVMVAAPGRDLLGFARFGPTRDTDDEADLVGQIRAIYLLPEVWGKGFGKRLMSTTLARLTSAGYSQATLWVLKTNTRARRFYELGGWTHDGTIRSDESQGFPIEDIRYRRKLPVPPARGGGTSLLS
jgi:GNAT superfamily N-acetyltransferase